MKFEAGESQPIKPFPATDRIVAPLNTRLLPPIESREQPANRLKLEKLEAIRKKVEKKLEKVRGMGEHFQELANQEGEEEQLLVAALFAEVSTKLFGHKQLKEQEEVCRELEKLDLESLNVEVFVKDLLEAPGIRAFEVNGPTDSFN